MTLTERNAKLRHTVRLLSAALEARCVKLIAAENLRHINKNSPPMWQCECCGNIQPSLLLFEHAPICILAKQNDSEYAVLGDVRQGLINRGEAITRMRALGHEDAQSVVNEWIDELEWEEIEADHRKAAGE